MSLTLYSPKSFSRYGACCQTLVEGNSNSFEKRSNGVKSLQENQEQRLTGQMVNIRVLDKPLSHWQTQARVQMASMAGASVWADNLFITPNWGACSGQNHRLSQGEVVVALPKETYVFQPFSPPVKQASLSFSAGSVSETVVALKLLAEAVYRVDPYGPSPHQLVLPVYEAWAINLAHWTQVLDTNLMALHWQKRQFGLSANNRIGRHVKIHPTAHVSGSVLEDHAMIEPFASVIDSQVCEKSRVAANSVLHTTVLGAGSQTLVDSHLRRVVVGQNTTIANLGLYDSLVGDDAFVTTAVSVFGQQPMQYPEIKGEKLYRPVIGVGIGDGAVVGARALFQAGVYLPKDALVVGRPDEAASKLDEAHLKRAKMQIGDPLEQV